MKDNIMSKMKELGIRGKPSEVILSDILGGEIGCRRVPGLLDSESHAQFVINLEKIKEEWLSSHPLSERFLSYFCKYKVEIIRQMMTAEFRSMAGLGWPSGVYDQNRNECMNSVLQREKQLTG